MDFIRKPEVLATANAVGTASIYFILSKRLTALTDEVDEIDNHLTSSIKKISDNSRSLQGITEAFKEVLTKFEDHKKNLMSFSKTVKKLEEEVSDINDRYDAVVSAVRNLGGTVDLKRNKKKKKKSSKEDKRRTDDSSDSDSESSSSESEREKSKSKQSEREKSKSNSESKSKQKDDLNSDEDFVKKTSQAMKK